MRGANLVRAGLARQHPVEALQMHHVAATRQRYNHVVAVRALLAEVAQTHRAAQLMPHRAFYNSNILRDYVTGGVHT